MKKCYSGINIQFPISQLILSGKKTIETRTYPIPAKYVDTDLLFIETPGTIGNFQSRIVGIIRFEKCFKYRSKQDFYRDINKHCVEADSPWAYVDSKGKWGWFISKVESFKKPRQLNKKIGIKFTTNIELKP